MFALFIFAILLLITYFLCETKKPHNFPPGPYWLPFVGSLPEVKNLSLALGGQHLALWKLAQQYKTNVLGLKLGKELIVVALSHPVVREVLTSDVYNARPDSFFLRLRCMGTKKGVTCTDGEFHSIQRSFVVRHLRNLGFGRKTMELMIKREVDEILSIVGDNGDIQIGKILAPSVLNILWSLTTGSRFERTNPQLDRLLDLLESRSKAFDMSGGTLSQQPWLRFIAPERTGYNLIRRLNAELKSLLMGTIDEHYKNWTDERSDDLIYSFITEMKKSLNNGTTTFTNDQLIMVCLDIFIAGSQTTSNTLDFAFLMMILYPDIQAKVQADIDRHLNIESSTEYADRQKLSYVEAVLWEVERFCHVAPIIGPRRVLEDTVLDGYNIPKGTTVLLSVYSVHHNKEYWGDPEVFRPERFLEHNGKTVAQDYLLGFGLGRRRCLGEILARSCIFLFFVEIMKHYRIDIVPGSKMPTGRPLPGITLSPERYKARFLNRR